MKPYDYRNRIGVETISWDRFANLCGVLAETLANLEVEMVVGVATAGLLPAATVARALRCELFPVRVTRRLHDEVIHEHPAWKVDVSPEVRGRRVVVIDEIADTGETLRLVAQRVRDLAARDVRTAALVSHGWANPRPDVVALTSDALVIFPWDQRVLVQGRWELHPEMARALALQSKSP